MNATERTETTETTKSQEGRMDTLVGYVLLGGVIASVVLVLAGLFWRWLRTGELGVDYTISGMNLYEFLLAEIRNVAAGAFRPRLLIILGIVTLLLTPYLRVAASLGFFLFVEHNWKYSLLTGFVLAVLTYSLFLR